MTSLYYDDQPLLAGRRPRPGLPNQPELDGPSPMAGTMRPGLKPVGLVNPGGARRGGMRPGMRPMMRPPTAPRINPLPVGNGISPTPPVAPPQGPPPPGAYLRGSVIGPENSARTQGYFGQLDQYVPQIMNVDRSAMERGARGEAASFLQPNTVQGGPAIGGIRGGPAIGGIQGGPTINPNDPNRMDLARGLRDEYTGALRTSAVQGGPAIDPTAANRVARGNELGRGFADYFQGGQLSGGPAIMPTSDPRVLAARGGLDQAVSKLGGVDRRALAKEILGDFDASSKEGLDKRISNAGARAAALGRIGHQGTERQVQEIQRGHEKDRASLATQLAAETSAGEIADRQAQAALMRSLVGDEFGYGQAERGERRGERDYSTGIERENLAATRDARARGMGFGADLAGAEIGDEANIRQERRGERGYRTGIEEANRAAEIDARRTGLGLAEGAADARLGQLARDRGELRGERGYRTDLEDRNRAYAVGERDYSTDLERENRAGAVGERDYRTGLELTNEQARQRAKEASLGYGADAASRLVDDRYRPLGVLSDLADRSYGMDLTGRNERRGERGYQDEIAERATDRRVQQYGLERGAENDAFTRSLAQLEAGRYGDPTQMELYGAGEDAAAGGDIMSMIPELMRMYALRQGQRAA